MANYSSNRRSICGAIGSRARLHAEKNGGEGEKEFEIPENVTEVEDVRAINGERERKKGRKKESVKMRDIED